MTLASHFRPSKSIAAGHNSACGSAFTYSLRSGNRSLVRLIRFLHYVLKPIHRRATGLALRPIRRLNQRASVALEDGSIISFPLGDVYWNPFIWEQTFDYESEIRCILSRLKSIDYVFFDVGANIGYWSILASSEMLGRKRVVAIEASRGTFLLLEHNRTSNNCRFHIRRNAIFEHDGEIVGISSGPHAVRHIDFERRHEDKVISLSLDKLAQEFGISNEDAVVIKLDVEGAEIPALKGGKFLLTQNTLVIYEDHGNDPSHMTTKFILAELDLPVFSIGCEGTLREIEHPSALDQIKTDQFKGYNFLTCTRGSHFHQWLASQTATSQSQDTLLSH